MRARSFTGSGFAKIALFTIAYLLSAFAIHNQYYQLIMTLVPIWAIFGISWNILSGYSGLVSFGHAAFFGLGAYTVALALVFFKLTPWIGIPLAGCVGGLAGALIGLPTLRLRGHYFALAMLAYPLALLYVFEWLGFQEVALPLIRDNPVAYMQFEDNRIYTAIATIALALSLVLSQKIERSRFGLSLLAIKQNEIAAEAAGIDAFRWKLKAITLSGSIAGAIGGFYAVILLIVTPAGVFGLLTSAQALIVVLFGGIGAAWGPVIGAGILIPLSEILHVQFGELGSGISGAVFGVAIVVIILVAPDGIYWKVRDLVAVKAKEKTPLSGTRLTGAPTLSSDRGRSRVESRTLLEVRGLSKSFGGLRAVRDVGFTVAEGTIVGIIGPNGAGKTTLFNLMNGILKPDDGQILFDGNEIKGLSPNKVCRLHIGRTFQVVRSFARLTVLQNVVVGAFVATDDDQQAERLARSALDMVGLTDAANLIAGRLTGKQLRLMELARALAGQPRLLLLDETLAGLGADEIEELLQIIDGLTKRGITIVIIEHTMQAMIRLADRLIVLDDGEVIATGNPEDITKNKTVIEAYLGKKWSTVGA